MKIKNIAICLTLSLVFGTGMHVYADSFRSWILQSTHIVLAENLWSDDYNLANDYEITSDRYRVNVVRNVYGYLDEHHISFRTTGGMVLSYDEPIVIEEGHHENIQPKVHMAFLQKKGDEYYLLGLMTELNEEDILFIESKILQIREIQLIQDTVAKFKKTIDWVVQCAANRHTSIALDDLYRFSNFIRYYENLGIDCTRKDLLTADQKKFLLDQMLKKNMSWEDLYMTDLLFDTYPTEITQAILSSLNHIPEGDYYFADNLMASLIEIKPLPALKKILENYEDESPENKRQKKLIRDFIKEYEKQGKEKK